MNDNDCDIGDEELEEIDEDDVEEVILDDLPVESDEDDSGNEEDMTGDSFTPARDDSDFVFKNHTGPVFCCALDPKNGNLAVTGGQDDKAYVWEIQEGKIVLECNNHKDSVTLASFNFDGSYVATADMEGLVQVWKVATKSLAWSYDSGADITWLRWHHGANVLFCATFSGDIYMWKIPSGDCKVLTGHGVRSECGVIMPDGRRAAVGYTDGTVKVYELKSCVVQGMLAAGEAHSQAVTCMDMHTDNNIVATGDVEGRINLLKTQTLKVLWSFDCSQSDANNSYVETLGFSKDPSLSLVAACTLGGKIYILDFAKQVLRQKCEQTAGICRLVWDRNSPTMFVGSLDGIVRIYDARNGNILSELMGHTDAILDIHLSADGNTLLSSSDDRTCRVYSVSPPER